jgi:hypothetical protein
LQLASFLAVLISVCVKLPVSCQLQVAYVKGYDSRNTAFGDGS